MLRECDNCPKYKLPEYESNCTIVAPKIKFHLYVLFTTCSQHELIGEGRLNCNLCVDEKLKGKIRSWKMLTQRELEIGNFMYDVYLSSLEKCIFNIYTMFQYYLRIIVENFESMLASRNQETYYLLGTTLKECLRTLILKYNLSILATEEVFRSKDV